jgi:hypothetical protein
MGAIAIQECHDIYGLDETAIGIIAEREHLPENIAAQVGITLTTSPEGVRVIRELIRDNLRQAAVRGELERSLLLSRALARFNARHRYPERRGFSPQATLRPSGAATLLDQA